MSDQMSNDMSQEICSEKVGENQVSEQQQSSATTSIPTSLPKLDIGSQAKQEPRHERRENKPFWDVCIASVRQFDNDTKKRFGFAAPVMWPDEVPEKFDALCKQIPDLKFSNLDGDCFFHLDRGGYVTDVGMKVPYILRPSADNLPQYQSPIEPPTLRELIVVARTVNERGNFAIWWCYLEDYLNTYRSLIDRPVFRLQEQSSSMNVKNSDGSITKPTEFKSRTLWMGQSIKELSEHWPAREYPVRQYEKFRRYFSVQDLNDQTAFHEIDFDPRLVNPQELDDKVAHVLQEKLEAVSNELVKESERTQEATEEVEASETAEEVNA